MTFNPASGSCEDANVSSVEAQQESGSSRTTRDYPGSSTAGNSPAEQTQSKMEIDISDTQGVRLGKCKWFNVIKGWGFIKPNDGGQDIFVHQSVIQMSGFRSLGEQEEVEFECKLTERGLEATKVAAPGGLDCSGSSYRPRPKKRYRRVRCYNCGAFANHIAAKCALGPQPKRCHQCKSEEHLVADCPNKKSEAQTGDDSSSTTSQELETNQ